MMFALWTAVTFLPAVRDGVLEGEAGDPLRRGAGDDLDALGGVRADHVLDARVQVLGVLADDHEVDVVVARLEALDRAGRAQVRVQAEHLAQRDVDAAEAGADRRRDRALERDLVAPDRLQDVLRERRPVLGHDALAGVLDLPLEGDARGVEDTAGRLRQLRTDAVAGDQGDSMGHARHSSPATPPGAGPPARARPAIRPVCRRGRRRCRDGAGPAASSRSGPRRRIASGSAERLPVELDGRARTMRQARRPHRAVPAPVRRGDEERAVRAVGAITCVPSGDQPTGRHAALPASDAFSGQPPERGSSTAMGVGSPARASPVSTMRSSPSNSAIFDPSGDQLGDGPPAHDVLRPGDDVNDLHRSPDPYRSRRTSGRAAQVTMLPSPTKTSAATLRASRPSGRMTHRSPTWRSIGIASRSHDASRRPSTDTTVIVESNPLSAWDATRVPSGEIVRLRAPWGSP